MSRVEDQQKLLLKRNFDGFFTYSHFKAILYRRLIGLVRSKREFLLTSFFIIIFSILTIVLQFLMKRFVTDSTSTITFNNYPNSWYPLAYIHNSVSERWYRKYLDILKDMYKNDRGQEPTILEFQNPQEFNNYTYNAMVTNNRSQRVFLGFEFLKQYPYNFTLYYNGSKKYLDGSSFGGEVFLTRMAWKYEFGREYDFTFTQTQLTKRTVELKFGMVGPILITAGVISIIALILPQPISDISGDTRDYMISYGLQILPYWLATFLIDFLIWIVVTTIVWAIFIVCNVRSYCDNMLTTWYIFFMAGPSFILMVYCLSYLYKNVETALRQIYIGLAFVLVIPLILDIVREAEPPLYLEFIYSFVPHLTIMRLLSKVLINISFFKKSFSYYWTTVDITKIHFSMQFINIILYSCILFCIEHFKYFFITQSTRANFVKHIEVFREAKKKHPVSEESIQMREKVESKLEPYAVNIVHCSRIYMDAQDNPIPAVNDVCLGVKQGSIFGFLGANGAGKSTLMKIMTGIIPPSNGDIYIDGKSVSKGHAKGLVAVCPQFNTHLCANMTPIEHFKLYSMIADFSYQESQDRINTIIEILDLQPYLDRVVSEMSGGQQRRLAVALSFFGDSDIILLDEPTSSLDPYARNKVHNLIKHFQGDKTFMLCTHLLGEAESLCDYISIMSRGTVYTCGSPQYLSAKFGTEHKIDVLTEPNPYSERLCDEFFQEKLPFAKLTIRRPGARIYSVPANEIKLAELFKIMKEGKLGNNGFNYYTCSTSSLERVFLEIVKTSEDEEAVFTSDVPQEETI